MSDRTALTRMQAAVDAGTLQRHLEWFSQVPRDTGGEGEDRAAAYLAAELESADVPVVLHEFAFLSYPRQASLRMTEPQAREFRSVTHSFARSTADEGQFEDEQRRGAGYIAGRMQQNFWDATLNPELT